MCYQYLYVRFVKTETFLFFIPFFFEKKLNRYLLFLFIIQFDDLNQIVVWVKENSLEISSKKMESHFLRTRKKKSKYKQDFYPKIGWLVILAWSGLNSKDQPYRVFTLVSMYYPNGWLSKNQWMVRNTKIHKGLVMEIFYVNYPKRIFT